MSLNVTVSRNVTDVSSILSNKLLGNGLDVFFLESKSQEQISAFYLVYEVCTCQPGITSTFTSTLYCTRYTSDVQDGVYMRKITKAAILP